MKREGKIIWCRKIPGHQHIPGQRSANTGKDRPVVVLGGGREYGIDPDAIVGITCSTTSISMLSPVCRTSLEGKVEHYPDYRKDAFLDTGHCIVFPYTEVYVKRLPEVAASQAALEKHFFGDVKKIADDRFVMPPHVRIMEPVFAEIRHLPESGSIVNFNVSAQKVLNIIEGTWLQRMLVLGDGAAFGLYPRSLVCCPYERLGEEIDEIDPILARLFVAPANSLYFPDAAIPVRKISESMIARVLSQLDRRRIHMSMLDRYEREVERSSISKREDWRVARREAASNTPKSRLAGLMLRPSFSRGAQPFSICRK